MNETEADHLRKQLEAAVHDAESLASRLSGMRPERTSTMTNGNGIEKKAIQVVSGFELHDKVARYRTALVALVAFVKREGGYMETRDQMLLAEVERLLEGDSR
jgi:hypothetical protein